MPIDLMLSFLVSTTTTMNMSPKEYSKMQSRRIKLVEAAIAQSILLQLPSCGPGFDSQAATSMLFQFIIEL